MKEHTILVFGEDDNDRRSIANLIKALTPAEKSINIGIRRRPTILSKDAARKRLGMADEIKPFADAETAQSKRVNVVVHRDCDAIEPAHQEQEKILRQLLSSVGLSDAVLATPAWEIETWWMLFPEALHLARKCWNRVNYGSKHVGMIINSKEQLRRDLRPAGSRPKACPDFAESDGILVSERISEYRLVHKPITARSDSFISFRNQLERLLR
jgi:hypothetical protein